MRRQPRRVPRSGAVGDRLAELEACKPRFRRGEARRKKSLLRGLARAEILSPSELIDYHESLSFLRAFPDDREVMELAEAELRRFAARIEACVAAHGGPAPAAFHNTGIAGTSFHYPYGLAMARWLVDRFGDAADLEWEIYLDREDDPIAGILAPLVGWVETAAVDDESLGTREWFEEARGKRKIGFLRWLIERIDAAELSDEMRESIFNEMELPIRWELGRGPASRTLLRAPAGRPFYHPEPLRGRTADLRAEIRRPLAAAKALPRQRAHAWIDRVRAALAVRSRELYPVALAHEGEVYECAVGRGVRIVLYGMLPDRRLPLEADYGAFVVKNGMPIGYGVGALLCDRMEIAVNIFPTFRQGESSFVFEQFNRLFHHQFGCKVFLVERYQLGHENDEGLEAGSFWFYHKLGFRSVDPRVAALAEEEAARLRSRPGLRTERRMLRRLARSDLVLALDPSESKRETISLTRIGHHVSRNVEERYGGDRGRAEREGAARVAALLSIDPDRWRAPEREAFYGLAPLLALFADFPSWTSGEKRELIRALRAKGGTREAPFARAMAESARIRRALVELSKP